MGSAVGVNNLAHIALLLAAGITRRFAKNPTPVDIYLCENMLDAATQLQSYVWGYLQHDVRVWAENAIGFVGTSVARMVPMVSEEFRQQYPNLVIADSYHKLPYDGTSTKAKQPPIEGMYPVNNFKAEVERKIFTYNLGHAALAYLGHLRGYSYVHETFEDETFITIFQQALDETGAALQQSYPEDIDAKSQQDVRADINLRFSNPMIQDTIQRVGRDPIRKLGAHDRLVGSANLCVQQGIFPRNIAIICAAALCYDEPNDPRAVELQNMIHTLGVEATLHTVSSLEPRSELGQAIIQEYHRFQEQRTGKVK
jgi:mannitol-1-phosphate 5-dehydrogenase